MTDFDYTCERCRKLIRRVDPPRKRHRAQRICHPCTMSLRMKQISKRHEKLSLEELQVVE